jgi:hypothetical protein
MFYKMLREQYISESDAICVPWVGFSFQNLIYMYTKLLLIGTNFAQILQ